MMRLRRRIARWLMRLADPDARTATESLREIWNEMTAIDDRLDKEEIPPTGDDYNDLWSVVRHYARPHVEDVE